MPQMSIKRLIPLVVLTAILSGCIRLPNQKGGSASVAGSSASSVVAPQAGGATGFPSATLAQPENPNSESSQDVAYELEEIVVTPYDTVKETITTYPDGRSVTVREPQPAGTKVIRKAKSQVNQTIGGSWYDKAKEIAAELGSFQVVQYVGIGVFLFGAVSFFHAGLRVLVGGKDTCVAIGVSGLVMMFGPFIFVKYSHWFFLAIIGAVIYWAISRFKYKEALLDAAKK